MNGARLKIVATTIFVFAVNGFRDAWIPGATGDAERFRVLAVGFVVASALAIADSAIHSPRPSAWKAVDWKSAGFLVATTAVGFPAYLIALKTTLGPHRTAFVDYALLPLFAVIASVVFEGASVRLARVGAIGVCLLGSLLVASSAGPRNSQPWPDGWSHPASMGLGLAGAIIASVCGALSLVLARRLMVYLDRRVVLVVRLVPVGPFLFVAGLLWIAFVAGRGRDMGAASGAFLSGPGWLVALGFGVLVFLQFFPLYSVLSTEQVARVAPYLFLVPVAVFLFSLILGTERLARTSIVEWGGMALILVGLAWAEFHHVDLTPNARVTLRHSPGSTP